MEKLGGYRSQDRAGPSTRVSAGFGWGQKNGWDDLMGKRGPAPKDRKTRELEGNPANRPLPVDVDEEDVSSGSLRMPQRLTEDERRAWVDTLSAFPSWYFTAADKYLMIAYVRALARLERSERALQNGKSVDTRANGSKCVSPHIAIVNSSLAQVVQLSEKLGITRERRRGIVAPSAPVDQSQEQDGGEQDIPDDLMAPPVSAQSE